MKKDNKALSGKNNERLKTHKQQNNQINAAWANIESLKLQSNVSIPSMDAVEEAKDWVDDGSKL